jgi:hypothetical protein
VLLPLSGYCLQLGLPAAFLFGALTCFLFRPSTLFRFGLLDNLLFGRFRLTGFCFCFGSPSFRGLYRTVNDHRSSE